MTHDAKGGDARIVSASRTWQQQHARMMRAYHRATSAPAVTLQAEDDYYSFFVWCFNLKDWLTNDPAVPAATKKAAEDLVNTQDPLKVCADLANGIKHLRADRRTRVDADRDAFQTDERIVVVAAGGYRDAHQIADACVVAWADFLREYGLM